MIIYVWPYKIVAVKYLIVLKSGFYYFDLLKDDCCFLCIWVQISIFPNYYFKGQQYLINIIYSFSSL